MRKERERLGAGPSAAGAIVGLAVLGLVSVGAACSSSAPAAPGSDAATSSHGEAGVDAARPHDAQADARKDAREPGDTGPKAVDAGCPRSGACHACLDEDPENCGACGVSCGTGGECAEGRCSRVLASGQGAAPNVVNDLLVDSANVYWIPPASGASNGAVLSVPIAGGTITTLASGIAQPEGLAQDVTQLYFVSHNVGIERVAKTGGATTKLLADGTLDGGVFPEFWLLLAGRDLFYVGGAATGVYDLPLVDGGVPLPVAPSAGVLGAPGTGYNTVAADDAGVYYDTTDEIVALTRGTNAVESMVQGSSPTAGDRFGPTFAIDEAFLYYVSNVTTDGGTTTSSLRRAPKTGGLPTPITSDSVTFNDGPIVVDATHVYWSHVRDASTMTGEVLAVPKAGGTVQTVATGCYVSCPFAIDATSVYWPGSDGTIRSAAKP